MGGDSEMKLHFRIGEYDDAVALVKKYHCSRRAPGSVKLVGSFHLDGGLFGDYGQITAAAFFSSPPTRWAEPVAELSRLVRAETPVPLSSLISKCCEALKKRGENLVVSFADKTQGHHGGVYQSASWLYGGCRNRSIDGITLNGVFIPGRTCNEKWGTRSPEKLRAMGIDARPHYDEGKHIYFKPLNVSGKTKAKRLGLINQPYPKSADSPLDELVPTSVRKAQPLLSAPITQTGIAK